MANVTKTVKSSGGDYTSLNAALAGQSADLTANCGGSGGAGILTIECYSMEDTTAATTGSGYTTSSSYYINITVPVAERHNGKWDTSAYRLNVNYNGRALEIDEFYTRLTGLQVKNSASGAYCCIYMNHGSAYIVDSCIIDGNDSIYFVFYDSSAHYQLTGTIRNSVIYNSARVGVELTIGSSGTVNLQNVTIASCIRDGLKRSSGTVNATNVACIGNGDNSSYFDFTGTITKTNCASTDATADGTNCETGIAHSTSTFVNVTAGSQDYHLVSGSGLIDQGTSLSGIFTTDIDGETRSGTWDIGADEYVAAAALPKFMYHYMHH